MRKIMFGALLALGIAAPAAAEETAPLSDDKTKVSFTPYLWIAGVKGDADLPFGDGPIDFEQSFTDTLSSLNFAFMGALNVEHGKFVAFVDGNFLSLNSGSNDIDKPSIVKGKVKTKMSELTPLAGYKVVDSETTSVELLGGARVLSLKNDIHLELPLRTIDAERDRSAVAPVVATRLKTSLGGPWGVSLYGDVGGMTDLDLTWQLFGAVNYRISKHWDVAAGYRHLSIQSNKSGADINVTFSGPLVGFTYRF